MATLGLPDTVVFIPKTPAVIATKVRRNFLPINGRDFNPGNQIHFSLACGKRGAFLDHEATFLKVKLRNKDTVDSLVLDGHAHSVFHLLEVYCGSPQLEYIREYGPLLSVLMDSQASSDRELKNGNILEGMDETNSRTGDTILTGDGVDSRVFCIPLVSGIIGSLAEKMLPVGAMTRDNLKVSLTLSDSLNLQISDAIRDVTDVELVCEYVMINDTIAQAIELQYAGGYSIPFTSFSLQSNSIASGLGSANILLSGNFTSVNTISSIFRLQASRDDKTKKCITGRANPIQVVGYWSYAIA